MTKREQERRARQRKYARQKKAAAARRKAAMKTGNTLGWRVNEWCALVGCSRPTVWRHNRDDKLNLVYIDKTPFVPRTEAVRLGFITE